MKALKKDKTNVLMKTIIVFVAYLLYSFVFNKLASVFNINNSILVNFVADILFLVFVLIIYKDKIEKDRDAYIKTGPFKSRMFKGICWVIIICAANILGSYLSTLLAGNPESANNFAILSLPYFYQLFKTLIFSSIAEEIVVKQSIRDVIDNNILFIIVSALIYSSMNVAYTSVTGLTLLANAIPYAIFAVVTGVLYVRNKDNLYMVMLVKLLYTLIPLVITLIGVGI